VAGCGSGRTEEAPSATPTAAGSVETGQATYYADSLAGHATASGEPYDPGELTAAHRTLPLGAVVEVARPDGPAIRVRINDRGPFGDERRIIDLSRRAAEELGILKRGVADVTVRVLSLPPARPKRRKPH
jgi:rare lipoprotein A